MQQVGIKCYVCNIVTQRMHNIKHNLVKVTSLLINKQLNTLISLYTP